MIFFLDKPVRPAIIAPMFFRKKTTPSGHVLQLIESYRDGEGRPRNRVVASLGGADIPKEHWKLLAGAVQQRLRGAEDELFAFDYPDVVRHWTDRIVRQIDRNEKARPHPRVAGDANVLDGVRVDKVTHEHTAILGPVLAGSHAWRALEMPECLGQLGLNDSQIDAAAAEVLNRLVDPRSENALGDWVRSTALAELFGPAIARGGRDRFYRVSDLLLKHSAEIEAHLRGRYRRMFSYERTMVLYDLTNTYFEGACEQNPKARRGRSKHKRDDCPQIVVGMVFDEKGFAMNHRIYEGNQSDSPTLIDMVESLKATLADEPDLFEAEPLVIVDGGLASRKNLEAIRAAGLRYLVNDSRPGRKALAEEFQRDDLFERVEAREGKRPVRVRKMADPAAPGDTLLLCKSEGRREKEQAIFDRAHQRLREALEALARRVSAGRLKDPVKIERAIGRVLSKHPRVARFYDVKLQKDASGNRVSWQSQSDQADADADLLGCYVLRTSNERLTADEIWRTYMTLTRAEDGFLALKSDLGLRPNRHHIESRVDAHVFITILAYHLQRFLLFQLECADDHRRWQSVNRILATHAYTTIVLPTTQSGTTRIRKAGKPEESQKRLYETWGIDWQALPTLITRHHAGQTNTEEPSIL